MPPNDRPQGDVLIASDLDPYEQGTFDGLCGIYAILNGMRLAAHPDPALTKLRCRWLFKRGMDFLAERGCLDVAHAGLPSKDWHALGRFMFDDAREHYGVALKSGRGAFRRLPGDSVAAIAQVERAVGRGIPVAVELQPALNHYTVVRAIDANTWQLFDSYDFKSIRRRSIGARGSGSRHYLGPRVIFFAPAA